MRNNQSSVPVIARRDVEYPARYELQRRYNSSNPWVKILWCDTVERALEFIREPVQQAYPHEYRIVDNADK